jgi:hypothetical protein
MKQNMENIQILILPEITKQKVIAADNIFPISTGLIIISILLAHRAQISSTLTKLTKQEIQQLPSMKWNAKQIAKSPIVRKTIAQLVVAETLTHEIYKFTKTNIEEANKIIVQTVENLAQSTPKAGSKILPPRAINENNLTSHRMALMAKYIGIWQAKPLYDPNSILKNISPTFLNPDELGKLVVLMHENLQIPIEKKYSDVYNSSKEKSHLEPLKSIVNEHLFEFNEEENDEDEKIIFDDAINFGTTNNITLIENIFPFISRPMPIESKFNEKIPEGLLNSPLFSYVANMNVKTAKEEKKSNKTISKKKK